MSLMSLEMKKQVGAANASPDEHVCTLGSCPEGNYYVSAIDGPSFYLMAGPYKTHKAALADVNKARDISYEHDGRAWFMSWGTVNLKDGQTKPGKLNEYNLI